MPERAFGEHNANDEGKGQAVEIRSEVEAAERRIRPYIEETPLLHSGPLSEASGCTVYLKLENRLRTGSFKLRGALSKLTALAPEERVRGVVTASSGNHGAAVAYGLRLLGMRGTIFVPEHASPAKVDAIRGYGGEVRRHGDDSVLTEAFARRYAEEGGMVYISPYNDPQVIGGQGTIGVELARQLEQIDAVFVAVGGGGLIAGIAGYLKGIGRTAEIVGCSPEHSAAMLASVRAGQVVDIESLPTLSDGTAGGIEPDTITFVPCRALVDVWVPIPEQEIAAALRMLVAAHEMPVEGAAAVAVAAFLKEHRRYTGRNVVLVICGANIDTCTLQQVLKDDHPG